jgi:hypothetical protein
MAIAARVRDVGTHQESFERLSVEEMSTATEARHYLPCGACSCCSDNCGNRACLHCESKLSGPESSSCGICQDPCQDDKIPFYTMCQIRKHNSEKSAWLVVGDDIYDATAYISSHPGGKNSILKKSGGVCDCVEDFHFHSKAGRQMWRIYYVGKVRKCPSQGSLQNDRQWWKFWI